MAARVKRGICALRRVVTRETRPTGKRRAYTARIIWGGTKHGGHPRGHGRLGRDIWALSTEITRRDTAGWERKVAIGGKVWALSTEGTREDTAGWEEKDRQWQLG